MRHVADMRLGECLAQLLGHLFVHFRGDAPHLGLWRALDEDRKVELPVPDSGEEHVRDVLHVVFLQEHKLERLDDVVVEAVVEDEQLFLEAYRAANDALANLAHHLVLDDVQLCAVHSPRLVVVEHKANDISLADIYHQRRVRDAGHAVAMGARLRECGQVKEPLEILWICVEVKALLYLWRETLVALGAFYARSVPAPAVNGRRHMGLGRLMRRWRRIVWLIAWGNRGVGWRRVVVRHFRRRHHAVKQGLVLAVGESRAFRHAAAIHHHRHAKVEADIVQAADKLRLVRATHAWGKNLLPRGVQLVVERLAGRLVQPEVP